MRSSRSLGALSDSIPSSLIRSDISSATPGKIIGRYELAKPVRPPEPPRVSHATTRKKQDPSTPLFVDQREPMEVVSTKHVDRARPDCSGIEPVRPGVPALLNIAIGQNES